MTSNKATIYSSLAVTGSTSLAEVVELINSSPIVEGMERVEFSADMLAGQYAAEAQIQSDYEVCEDSLNAHLEILNEAGATFDTSDALAHALKYANASEE